jgi:TIR domain/AAA domain
MVDRMPVYQLEQVFNEASYPQITFVEPKEYPYIRSSFRAQGKHITISGPSGTGKTTLVNSILKDLNILESDVLWINGRQYTDFDSAFHVLGQELKCQPTYADLTPLLQLVEFIVLDDFHHLRPSARLELARNLKLWHEQKVRFVTIGIASSAKELYGADPELGIRNDPFELKTQDAKFCRKLIQLGEAALNIKFSDNLTQEIVAASNGVPSIMQVICKTCSLESGISQTIDGPVKKIDVRLSNLRDSVLRIFHGKYMDKVVGLAKGKQQARSVHNTYFDIVSEIAGESSSEIPTELLYKAIVATISDPKQRAKKATSFYNCLNNLSDVISEKGLDDTIFYSKGGKYISIEDPTFRFYLNLLDIEEIRARIDLRSDEYPYDVAVSFAGDIRPTVEEFVRALQQRGLSVFYDFDQQALLWGKDLRKKLAEVYANEALYMIIFLSKSYPERDWPDFELAVGKEAERKRTEEYLLPMVVDDVNVVGIRSTIGSVHLKDIGITRAAELLEEKIHKRT